VGRLRLLFRFRVYLHGRSHAGDELHTIRYLIDLDMHGNALGQAHPGEDRVDRRKPHAIRLRVRDADAPGDAVDVAANEPAVAQQLDLGRIAHVDPAQFGLLEIPVNPERIRIDDGDLILPDIRIIAELHYQVCH